MLKVIGIIIVLVLATLMAFFTCKSRKSDVFKWVGVALFIAFALTWVLPYGYYQEGSFYDYGMNRIGLSDIPVVFYYSIYFCLNTLIYLLTLGGFYGILSKSNGYKVLVKRCANVVKNMEVPTIVILILLLAILTSIIKSTMVILVFVPFIISVLLNAKYDKMLVMGITFGSILIGFLGTTYGTESLYYFNYYSQTNIEVGLYYRLIIGLIALVSFIAYNIYYFSKKNAKKDISNEKDELYAVGDTRSKAATWPIILVFVCIAIFIGFAYISWEDSFGIKIFNDFHTWLTNFEIGKDNIKLFSYIIGKNAVAFGKTDISVMVVVLLLASIIVGLFSKMNIEEFGSNFAEGISKIIKPVSLYVLVYAVFSCAYNTPFTTTISDWAYGLTKSFNPFIAIISSFVSSIFNTDLGYTSYLFSTLFTTKFASDLPLAHTIYVTTYGLVQVALPTSGILLIGLSYMNISYKSWIKYIWMYAVLMLVVLLAFVAIVRYAM